MTSTPPRCPEQVGRYEVLVPIASGGMATVYLARTCGARGFESEVALKLTHPHLRESAEFASMLLDEAKLVARIRHRNVVSMIDAGDDPHGIFLVMEYVEGETLAGLRRQSPAGPLPTRIAVRILVDALAGLHAAHELRDDQGAPLAVVHRDFTPHNILVGIDGTGRLADFGIAKAASRLCQTRTGNVKGKVGYMSPEQAAGAPLDRRCDVWAAGVMAWEIFAGRRLHVVEDEIATMLKVVSEPPPRLSTVAPSIHPDVDAVVASALEMTESARCPTAATFARALADACKAQGGVAEREEVAEWVSRAAEAKLSARRAQAEAVRAARAESERADDSLVDGIGAPSSSPIALDLPAGDASRTPTGPTWPRLRAPTAAEVDRETRTRLSVAALARRWAPKARGLVGIGATLGALTVAAFMSATRADAGADARAEPANAVTNARSSAATQGAGPAPTPGDVADDAPTALSPIARTAIALTPTPMLTPAPTSVEPAAVSAPRPAGSAPIASPQVRAPAPRLHPAPALPPEMRSPPPPAPRISIPSAPSAPGPLAPSPY